MATRLLKGVTTGAVTGADEVSRYLSPTQRAMLVTQLSGDAEARADGLLADARGAAAAILADAEAEAEAIRAQARAEGFAAGHDAGHAAAWAAVEASTALLRQAVEGAAATRKALLEGVEEQAVALALTAARRVVGAAAEGYAGLAAEVVRRGVRAAGGRVLRVRVNPADAEPVTAELLASGTDVPVQPDTAVETGGCVLDLDGGTVDLRLDAQMESIERALMGA